MDVVVVEVVVGGGLCGYYFGMCLVVQDLLWVLIDCLVVFMMLQQYQVVGDFLVLVGVIVWIVCVMFVLLVVDCILEGVQWNVLCLCCRCGVGQGDQQQGGKVLYGQVCSRVGSYRDNFGKKVMISSMFSVVNQNGQIECMFLLMVILLIEVLMNSIEFIGGVISFRLLVSISIRLKWIGLMLQVLVIGRKIGVQIRIIGVRFMKVFSSSSIIMIISSIMNLLCVKDCRNFIVVVGIFRQVSSQLNIVVVVIMNRIMLVLCVVWVIVLRNLCQLSWWYSIVVISSVQIIVMVVFFIVVKMFVWILMKISVIRFSLGRVEISCSVIVCQLGNIFMLQL